MWLLFALLSSVFAALTQFLPNGIDGVNSNPCDSDKNYYRPHYGVGRYF